MTIIGPACFFAARLKLITTTITQAPRNKRAGQNVGPRLAALHRYKVKVQSIAEPRSSANGYNRLNMCAIAAQEAFRGDKRARDTHTHTHDGPRRAEGISGR